MDKQAVFDKVARHLLTQMVPAMSTDGACFYQTSNGLRCAVGVLMPDDSDFHNVNYCGTVRSSEVQKVVCKGLGITSLDKEDLDLLFQLQAIHDTWKPELWENCLKGLADELGLKWYLDASTTT